MSTTSKNETQIIADPNLPTIAIVREFDAPPERVFRAWVEPDLVSQWLGPRSTTMQLDTWDCRTGGSYRYAALRDGEEIARFYGAFHEVRPSERLVQTFTYEGVPDGVSLETMTFEELDGGRTRVTALSIVDTMESRDAVLSSGMDVGVNEGYEKLDELLAEGAVIAADEHRLIAAGFTERVLGAEPAAWENPAPPEGWVARDVVRHLVEWFPPFLAGGCDVRLPPGPSVDVDPVGAWVAQRDAVQAVLDAPATAQTTFHNPHIGELPLDQAISRFYTADVFMHTWDLARATGQDDTLDQERCAMMLAGMEPYEEAMRASGQYGPAVDVPPDADPQSRLLAFIGRDPNWSPRAPT